MRALSRFYLFLLLLAPMLIPVFAHAADTHNVVIEELGGNDNDRPYIAPPSTGSSRAQIIGLSVPLAVMTLATIGLAVALGVVHVTDEHNCDTKYDPHFSNESACNSSEFYDTFSHVSRELFEQVKDACYIIISNYTDPNNTISNLTTRNL
jgi:hypothetical protein